MPVHENLAVLRNKRAKRGITGAVGGHAEIPFDATGAGSARYDAQSALGDPKDPALNSATGVNEVQRLTPGGTITGGTYTITFSGQTTVPIAHNASLREIKKALMDLSNIGAVGGMVEVTGGPLGPHPGGVALDIKFLGSLGAENVAQVTTTVTGLTGTTPTVTPSTVTAGAA